VPVISEQLRDRQVYEYFFAAVRAGRYVAVFEHEIAAAIGTTGQERRFHRTHLHLERSYDLTLPVGPEAQLTSRFITPV
jgi:hypothetical protein